jgi:hypothetical protein
LQVRLFCVLFCALAACERQAPPPAAAPPANCLPLPGTPSVSADAPVNSTPLRIEPLVNPSSKTRVRFVAPEAAEVISVPKAYLVRVAADALDADALGVDLALDSGRPRRLAPARNEIALGELVPADADLGLGEHWLFAAAVSASGLVPQAGPGALRAAVARRFFVGKASATGSGPSGAVWLRKPEGTYNGASSQHVLFDAFAFDAAGIPRETPINIALSAPGSSGQLRLPAPFFARDLPSGDYEVTVTAAAAPQTSRRFTVNRELGGGP